jgi:DNA-directed RNA polymerase specialized sigma24 family protein
LTDAQFKALAQLLRLRQGSTREAVRQHLVQGLNVPDAARAAGMDYRAATYAVKRAKDGLALAKVATGSV